MYKPNTRKCIYPVSGDAKEERTTIKFSQKLGEGKFSQVYRGRFGGQDVAVKVIPFNDMAVDENTAMNEVAILTSM